MKNVFHLLKVELVNGRYRTREQAKADVFECIETCFDAVRRHSSLELPATQRL